jgi:subtilase family serine protease
VRALALVTAVEICGASASAAQTMALIAQELITQQIDENNLVRLDGNTRPEATKDNDRGPLADNSPLDHLWLLLRRPSERETALERFLEQQTDPRSPNYHHWLTARQLGAEYGPALGDITKVTDWLQSHGFAVNLVYPHGELIDFSGTASQVHETFHTEIHNLDVNGEKHIANMSDPRIPAALAPAIVGVVSLNDFMPYTMHRMMDRPSPNDSPGGFNCGYLDAPCNLVVPTDLATIYNLNPLFESGYSGKGQTIVVAEPSDVYSTGDWATFRSMLGLSSYTSGSFTQIQPEPGSLDVFSVTPTSSHNLVFCTDPGAVYSSGHQNYETEATLDAEWASAAAPNAAIELASCESTKTIFGAFIALQNLLSETSAPPAIVSISYGDSEEFIGQTYNAFIESLYRQAAAGGVSVFVSSGDAGAAASDYSSTVPPYPALHGIAVSGYASTTQNVAVGGTDFGDTYSGTSDNYWGSNGPDYGSAKSYIPEIVWNQSCASELIAQYVSGPSEVTYGSDGFCNSYDVPYCTGNGTSKYGKQPCCTGLETGTCSQIVSGGSGGPSGCATGAPSTSGVMSGSCKGYAKPKWQSVLGNPADGVRDIPDVSLFAAEGVWGHFYVFCWSDTKNGGASCSGAPLTGGWSVGGGTSFATPIMAGFQALANQWSGTRQGNPNPHYYTVASSEYGSSGNADCNSSLGNTVSSSCAFYDVTLGDMDVPCTDSNNCYLPSGTYGVLSTSASSYQPAYGTNIGWDFATGIGTVNAYNLVKSFASPVTLKIAPSKCKFPKTEVGKASSPKRVKVSNPKGTIPVVIEMISTSGAFTQTNNCPGTLSAGDSCEIFVTFIPSLATKQTGTLTIADHAEDSTLEVRLKGTGK